MIWNVIDTVDLFHTGTGERDWLIHLCREGILAIPAGAADPAGSTIDEGGAQPIEDQGDPQWMRFPLAELGSVVVRQRFLAGSRLMINTADGDQHKFSTDSLPATGRARRKLSTVYPNLYREEKFTKPAGPD